MTEGLNQQKVDIMKILAFIVILISAPLHANADEHDWRYVPFFDHAEVQECAKARAVAWADEGKYSASEIMEEAVTLNRFLPELTKTSDRDIAHTQLGAMALAWRRAQENLRPGFELKLHEYAYGLVVTCTFDVFDRHYQ